jgi:hypothetical protein
MATNQNQIVTVENISLTGRIFRIAIGVAMILPLFIVSGSVGMLAVLGLLAIFPMACGIDGFCPLTAWYQRVTHEDKPMSKTHRYNYAVLAVALIAPVFFAQGYTLGIWAVLPLLAIYPAIVAIYGENLFAEVLRSNAQAVKQTSSGEVHHWQFSSHHDKDHHHFGHAA